jgi:glycosyltransferase involved in cell wall biosynthesis
MKGIKISANKNLLKIISIFIIILLPNCLKIENINSNITPFNVPKVTVFLPIYNKAEYLPRSISSIQNQTLKEVEIVAINDCSTDDTLKVLKKLAKNDSRIKIINNDRNHGLLYSRAMGIINSTGEYVINLDPDDQFEGIHNLEILYKLAKNEGADIILYLLQKHQPTEVYRPNISEIYKEIDPNISSYKSTEKKRRVDYLITNKFSKREVLVKAYKVFAPRIHSHRWNFHEDNIWCYIIRKYAKKKVYIDRVMYIYLLNKESLMKKITYSNILDIKNRIYLDEMLYKLFGRQIGLGRYFLNKVNGYYRAAAKSDRDIKVRLIHNLYSFMKVFKQKKINSDDLALGINKFSSHKIIIYNQSNKKNLEKDLIYLTLFRFLGIYTRKKIIYIDANYKTKIDNSLKFIFPADILVSIDDLLYQSKYDSIIKYFSKNKIISFAQNIQNPIFKKKEYTLNSHVIFGLNSQSYEIAKNYINLINSNNSTQLYYIPNFLENWANFFNYKLNMNKNNNILIWFGNQTNNIYFNESNITNIISQYFSNIAFQNITNETKLLEDNYENYISIFNEYKLIITDNLYIMKLSAIYSTSCILFKNDYTLEVNKI